ncbi:osteopetrosis-associated transmembrane protein 1 isoform X1 [Protopterus annectens]|uniref:osteopetrosis-associated transmembrane protein 1 isoform X1 n=1 Tax=Protopterus annectens TaxID=7888 RepID=UPI001CF9DF21|nr:osteopetrosis-associated transmembrane protein 1 isoform X1 [Protopterus annectens]
MCKKCVIPSVFFWVLVLSFPVATFSTSYYEWGIPNGNADLLKASYKYLWPSSFTMSFGLFRASDFEVSSHCRDLLEKFVNVSRSLVECLLLNAKPVRICQNCYMDYQAMNVVFGNLTGNQTVPANLSCDKSLLHSDRLQIVPWIQSSLQDLWTKSLCDNCLTDEKLEKELKNETIEFIDFLNDTWSCFDQNVKNQGNIAVQSGNQTVCDNCKDLYRNLSKLYDKIGKKCIDIEDGMNITKRLWSSDFNCTVHTKDTVPVIAITAFLLFLPIVFYLSSFLHSEQKKRKLIQPKRLKSSSSLGILQDNHS